MVREREAGGRVGFQKKFCINEVLVNRRGNEEIETDHAITALPG